MVQLLMVVSAAMLLMPPAITPSTPTPVSTATSTNKPISSHFSSSNYIGTPILGKGLSYLGTSAPTGRAWAWKEEEEEEVVVVGWAEERTQSKETPTGKVWAWKEEIEEEGWAARATRSKGTPTVKTTTPTPEMMTRRRNVDTRTLTPTTTRADTPAPTPTGARKRKTHTPTFAWLTPTPIRADALRKRVRRAHAGAPFLGNPPTPRPRRTPTRPRPPRRRVPISDTSVGTSQPQPTAHILWAEETERSVARDNDLPESAASLSESLSPSSLSSEAKVKRKSSIKKTYLDAGQTQVNRQGAQEDINSAIRSNFTLKSKSYRYGSIKTSCSEAENSGFTLKSIDYGGNTSESGGEDLSESDPLEKDINNNVSVQKRSADVADSEDEQEDSNIANEGDGSDADEAGKEKETTNKHKKRRRRRRGRGRGRRRGTRKRDDLSLWIDGRQVKMFSGYVMEIFAIHDGHVLPYILDPNFEKHLPVIPSEVESVNFTWQAGRKRYYYKFDRLYSQDEEILHAPVVSMATHGRVPKKPKVFTINIQCTGNASGVATFGIGLLIQSLKGKPLPGTPLRLQLRKECTQHGPDPECDQKCENGGVCDVDQRCLCPEGYMGQYCKTALCYPQCMNGGTCTTPGRCSCPPGFQGRHCEGGICRDKCENGGKCVQKDTCECPRGYYGNRCEFSKCVIPCVNGGRCRDVNKCRCPNGFAGDHCEIVLGQMHTAALNNSRCTRKCKNGSCSGSVCECELGYSGRWCRRRSGKTVRRRIWL